MDFYSLTRRDLQTLCKKNKIPANITNVAMADALKALEIVEGIEELLEPSQSETAHSSVESPTRSEVTSPYVPPTGGRTTRRRNVAKEEPVTANPMTRNRRTTRKGPAEAIETPALAVQTNRKKVQVASACRKMDSQFKECVEEEKKDVSMTSRRRGVKEESTVKRVYSTRRSMRLAEKNDERLNGEKNEESELFKKEILTEDSGENEKMNLNAALDDVDEVSEITGSDAITNPEENSENEEQTEVVSAQEQGILIGKEIVLENTAEEETCVDFEIGAKLDEEACEKTEDPHGKNMAMKLNVSNEAQQTDGNYAICTSEIEITADNTEEMMNTEKDAEPEEKAADFVENVALESKDDELSDVTGFPDEIQKESSNDKDISLENVPDFTETMEKLTELKLQQAAEEVSEADSACIPQLNQDEPEKTQILQLEESEKAADPVPSDAAPYDQEAAANANINNSPSEQQGGVEDAEGIPLHSASKTSITMKRMVVFSDNKENMTMKIGKKTTENVENLNDLSMRKLTKMLKEKLEITKKSSKNDHGNEALSRPALQALPENRLIDETQN